MLSVIANAEMPLQPFQHFALGEETKTDARCAQPKPGLYRVTASAPVSEVRNTAVPQVNQTLTDIELTVVKLPGGNDFFELTEVDTSGRGSSLINECRTAAQRPGLQPAALSPV
jgi:hypothetical protein